MADMEAKAAGLGGTESRNIRGGVIGVGQVGRGVALCLDRLGMLSAVYDICANVPEGLPPFEASPLELARKCDVVIIAVVSADQAIDVLSGPDGILAAGNKEHSIILLSTVALDDLARVRAVTDAAGVVLIDCGVMGAARSADKGMVCLVGAEQQALNKVRPILDGFARYVAHMGGPGAGMTAKIVRNVVAVGCLRAGYEGALLAKATGVDLQRIVRAIEDTADANVGPMILMGRTEDPAKDPAEAIMRNNLRKMIVKDAEAALRLADMVNVSLPLVEIVIDTDRDVVGL